MEISLLMVGWLSGVVFSYITFRYLISGILNIETSDSEESPYLFLELFKGVHVISKKKYVFLKINNIKNNTPK